MAVSRRVTAVLCTVPVSHTQQCPGHGYGTLEVHGCLTHSLGEVTAMLSVSGEHELPFTASELGQGPAALEPRGSVASHCRTVQRWPCHDRAVGESEDLLFHTGRPAPRGAMVQGQRFQGTACEHGAHRGHQLGGEPVTHGQSLSGREIHPSWSFPRSLAFLRHPVSALN